MTPSARSWRESAGGVALASGLMLLATWPAFDAYFFGEAFLYLGQYWGQQESFWRALASPNNVIFFKPVCFAASLPWYFVLPLDPWAYHVRNFGFSVVVLLILHRVLLRLVESWRARMVALALFAASKVHLTTIGYIMIFDSIVMLLFLLLALLATLRWCAGPNRLDQVTALVACAACAFTKDYGFVAVVVVLATVLAHGPTRPAVALAVWGPALVAIAFARVGLRYAVVGPMPWSDPVYAPAFSLAEVARKGIVLLSAASNLSIGRHDKTGASGWGTLLFSVAHRLDAWLPTSRVSAPGAIDAAVAVAGVVLVLCTAMRIRVARRSLGLPLVWVTAFFVPPLFTRNLQIYYGYESLAGMAVLLGVALDRASRRMQGIWTAAVVAIALAGIASNHAALYDWQFAADSARRIEHRVLAPYRGAELRSLTFVTDDVPFWRWVLTADNQAPMLEVLLDRPGLPVRVMERAALARAPRDLHHAHLVLDADRDFAPVRPPSGQPPHAANGGAASLTSEASDAGAR